MAVPEWLTLSQMSGSGDAVITVTASTMEDLSQRIGSLLISGNTKTVTVPVYQHKAENKIFYRTSDHQALTLNTKPYAGFIKSHTYDSVKDIGTIEFYYPPTDLIMGGPGGGGRYVPSSRTLNNWIGYYCYLGFSRQATLTEISFPDSFCGVNSSAFTECTALQHVDFGLGCRYVGTRAFIGCSGLSEFTLYQQHPLYCHLDSFSGSGLSAITINANNLGISSNNNGGINGHDYQTTDGHQYIYVPASFEGVSDYGVFHTPGDYVRYGALNINTAWTKTYDVEVPEKTFEIDRTSVVCDAYGAQAYSTDNAYIYTSKVYVYSKDRPWNAYYEFDPDHPLIPFSPTSGGTGLTEVTFDSTGLNYHGRSLQHKYDRVIFDNGEEIKPMTVTHYTELMCGYKTASTLSNYTMSYVDAELLGPNAKLPDYQYDSSKGSYTDFIIYDGYKQVGTKLQGSASLTRITSLCPIAPSFDSDSFSGVSSTGTLYYPAGSDYSSWLTALGPGWNGVELDERPMTMTITSPGQIRFTTTIGYKLNGGARQILETSSTITVTTGDIVEFYQTRNTYSGATFSATTAGFKLSGNIMSILYDTNFVGQTTLKSADTFNSLFMNCTGLTDASELYMPATMYKSKCYYQMFRGCTNLTKAPKLYLDYYNLSCCSYMFYGCTSLTTPPPEIKFTTFLNSAGTYMFAACTSLTTSPRIEGSSIGNYSASYMFSGCSSLSAITCITAGVSNTGYPCRNWVIGVSPTGVFTKKPDTTWGTGVNSIPTGWVVQDA